MELSSRKVYEWWQQQLARYFTWWVIGTIVLVVGGGSWLWLWPLYQDVRANNQAVELAARLSETKLRLGQLKLKAEAWAAKRQDEAINLILPSYADLPSLLTELEALAEHSRLRLQGIVVAEQSSGLGASARGAARDAGAQDPGIRQLKINLTLGAGNYSRLRDFLRQAKSAWRVVAVKSLTFGRDGVYSVELTSYYYTH